MSATPYVPAASKPTSGLPYYLRVLRVVGAIDFKAKYTDAALGYVWSVVKPLAYFGVLWLVFAYLLRTANQTDDFTLFLLVGILLFLFFIDAVSVMLPSIVDEGATLRRLAFPPILIPLSASVAIAITFCLNATVFAVFAAIQMVEPRLEWLLVPPLLVELVGQALPRRRERDRLPLRVGRRQRADGAAPAAAGQPQPRRPGADGVAPGQLPVPRADHAAGPASRPQPARGPAVAIFSSAIYLGQTLGVAIAALVFDRFTAVPLFAATAVALPALAWWFARTLRRHSMQNGAKMVGEKP